MPNVKTIESDGRAGGRRFALVVSTYHDFVTDKLQTGALAALMAAGVADGDIVILRVPGTFELPLAAQHAVESDHFDAIICLGCLIRGETLHMDYIASAVTARLLAAACVTGVPMAFGVLTTNSVEEAIARAGDGPSNKGHEAAIAALGMASVVAQLTRPRAAS